jgi:hypothetical protein
MTTSIGKTLRLARFFDPDTRNGLAAYAASAFAGRAGWVQRIAGRSGLSAEMRNHQLLIGAAVDDAMQLLAAGPA